MTVPYVMAIKQLRMGITMSIGAYILLFLLWEHMALENQLSSIGDPMRRTNPINRRPIDGKAQSIVDSRRSEKQPCLWKVMFWEHPFQPDKVYRREGHYHCPETNCTVQFTHNSSYDVMRSSHVVILNHAINWNFTEINSIRRSDQIMVYMSFESPVHSLRLSDMGFFNWTMTYNARSEIFVPYGAVTKNLPSEKLKAKNWAEGKTGLAIWIISNCQTTTWPRMSFGETLAKFMKIDIYGKCGSLSCADGAECRNRIYSYKFYITFENSLCEDYITEKVWRNAFTRNSVPIVYGASKSCYERIAPRNSFIHISDFSDMSSLAAYIDLLDKNDTLYNEYFEWRRDYHVIESCNAYDAVSLETLCSIPKRLEDSGGLSTNRRSTNTEWFRESCSGIPRPEMV